MKEDESREPRGGAGRVPGAGLSIRRNELSPRITAPAGTPMNKAPVEVPQRALPTSDRPPGSQNTLTPSRTVGGRTARLKAPEPDLDEPMLDEEPAPAAPVVAEAAPQPSEDATPDKPPTTRREGSGQIKVPAIEAPPIALAAIDLPVVPMAKAEAQVKPEPSRPPSQQAVEAPPAEQVSVPSGSTEELLPGPSRWTMACAIWALSLCIGGILPLPFREQISPGRDTDPAASASAFVPSSITQLTPDAPSAHPSVAAPVPVPVPVPSAPPAISVPGRPVKALPGKGPGKTGRPVDIF